MDKNSEFAKRSRRNGEQRLALEVNAHKHSNLEVAKSSLARTVRLLQFPAIRASLICLAIGLAALPINRSLAILLVFVALPYVKRRYSLSASDLCLVWLCVAIAPLQFDPFPAFGLHRFCAVLILFAAWSEKRGARFRIITNRMDWLLLFFLIAAFVSIVLSGMIKLPLRMFLDALLIPFLLYILGKNYVNEKGFLQKVYFVSVLILLLIASLGLAEKIVGQNLFYGQEVNTRVTEDVSRLRGPFLTTEEFGVVLVSVLALIYSINGAFKAVPTRAHLVTRGHLLLIATVGAVICIFGTLTRGIWLAALASFGYLFYRRKPALAAITLILLPVGYGLVVNGLLSAVLSKEIYSSRVSGEGTINSRLATYQSALAMAADHPVLGVGYGAYQVAYERDLSRYERYYEGERSVPTPHNNVLQVLVETGPIGLIIYICFFAAAVLQAGSLLRTSSNEHAWGVALAARSMVIGYQTAGLGLGITNDIHYMNKLVFFVLGLLSGMVDLKMGEKADGAKISVLR